MYVHTYMHTYLRTYLHTCIHPYIHKSTRKHTYTLHSILSYFFNHPPRQGPLVSIGGPLPQSDLRPPRFLSRLDICFRQQAIILRQMQTFNKKGSKHQLKGHNL